MPVWLQCASVSWAWLWSGRRLFRQRSKEAGSLGKEAKGNEPCEWQSAYIPVAGREAARLYGAAVTVKDGPHQPLRQLYSAGPANEPAPTMRHRRARSTMDDCTILYYTIWYSIHYTICYILYIIRNILYIIWYLVLDILHLLVLLAVHWQWFCSIECALCYTVLYYIMRYMIYDIYYMLYVLWFTIWYTIYGIRYILVCLLFSGNGLFNRLCFIHYNMALYAVSSSLTILFPLAKKRGSAYIYYFLYYIIA